MAVILSEPFSSFENVRALVLPGWAAIAFGYFVVLKRSKGGTLGYRIAGVKIVGLDGRPASWSALTLRLLFAVFGPLNWLDLIWLAGDPHRQTLRDKLAQTYVVKKKAEPLGTGPVFFQFYEINCYNFIFREVAGADRRPRPSYFAAFQSGSRPGVGGAPAASSCFSSALISVSTSLRSLGISAARPSDAI
jgi:hypothetical protein